ncbi:MAG: hypothetical protein RL346_403 [Verrucomicrobiota bacterium]
MIFRLSILLLTIGAVSAKDPITEATKNPMSLLPTGSVLHGVLLPRYDKDRKLVGDLKAEIMTLIDPELIQGDTIRIQFYQPDGSLRGKIQLQKAVFNQTTSRLRADEPVRIDTDRLVANGAGLIYAFQQGQGFLIGPASTRISYPDSSTTMRSTPTKTAALVALGLTHSTPNGPAATVPAETKPSAIHATGISTEETLDRLEESIQDSLREDLASSEQASKSAREFAKSSGLQHRISDSQNEAAPLETAQSPNDTVIRCDGGMYFDAEAGVLVYLKNVSVDDPRFTLKGADELKVFFAKKEPQKTDPAEKKETAPESRSLGVNASFGDVQKIIATGTVHLLQKSVAGKPPVEASGGLLTYDIPKGEIIISQRYPWVKQGTFYARARQPNLTLRILNNGSFSTQGNWEMGGRLKLDGR